jgi:hypothetical protein
MPVYTPLGLIFGDVLTAARAAYLETQYALARERARPLGGIPDVGVTDTSYIDAPGAIVVRIAEPATARLHVMGLVSAGTGSLRLWDVGGAAVVASSELTFTDTDPTLQESPDLELAAGDYKLQTKISVGTEHVIVYGACLVTR